MDQLVALRARCERQTGSIFTPMGEEMYYRYQRSLIEQAIDTLAALLRRPATPQGAERAYSAATMRWSVRATSVSTVSRGRKAASATVGPSRVRSAPSDSVVCLSTLAMRRATT